MGSQPHVVVDLDSARDPLLVEHRRVNAIEGVVAADQVRVGGDEGMLAESDATAGENLAVEADVGVVVDDDVAVLAAQDRSAADEDTVPDVDAPGCWRPSRRGSRRSSITTLSPMRILWGWRSTTLAPKVTLRPTCPSSSG